MEIDEKKLKRIVAEMDKGAFDLTALNAFEELKELINEKWEPKEYGGWYNIGEEGEITASGSHRDEARLYGNEWETEELAKIARDINKRNQLILQAKHEMGYGDGGWVIQKSKSDEVWMSVNYLTRGNPELTFETKEQAMTVIQMVGLND